MDKSKISFLLFSILLHITMVIFFKNTKEIEIKKIETDFIKIYDEPKVVEDFFENILDKNSNEISVETFEENILDKNIKDTKDSNKLVSHTPEVVSELKENPVVQNSKEPIEKIESPPIETNFPVSNSVIEEKKQENTIAITAKKSEEIVINKNGEEKKVKTINILGTQETSQSLGESKEIYIQKIKKLLTDKKKYPDIAKRMKKQGEVSFELTLGDEGQIKKVVITKSSGHKILDDSTLEVLETIKILPKPPKELDKISFSYKYELIK